MISKFENTENSQDRLKMLMKFGRNLQGLPKTDQDIDNRIMGCATQVWMKAKKSGDGSIEFSADSDSDVSRGICAVLFECFQGMTPEEILQVPAARVAALGTCLGSALSSTPSRSNGLYNVHEGMRARARVLSQGGQGASQVFPSLTISQAGIRAEGAFAQSQALFLTPDPASVQRLADTLAAKKIGIVAHFYMDPEVQGVLSAAGKQWPHVDISDSLVMADRAVAMVEAGCTKIVVLGVDFMAENVRAVLDGAGWGEVPVLRLAAEDIGCSLAEAAEAEPYMRYLEEAQALQEPSLHVIYINTSLYTKGRAHALVPTITCTSSNVVTTVLQAAAQVPGINIWYGPDTYMGGNLVDLFERLTQLGDDEVKALHPEHTVETIRALLPRLRYFREGTCIVHHVFGGEVCAAVRAGYSDAFQTAHFEVPGEMFTLAMEAKERGMGTVGSTKNILDFISDRLSEALDRGARSGERERLRFVLGTEAGMITSIVNKVKDMLAGQQDLVEVEVIFPVSSSAIATTETVGAEVVPELGGVVPGAAGGEGCSAEGGCASCPYMKMNSLSALFRVVDLCDTPAGEVALSAFEPKKYSEVDLQGRTMADRGVLPITHMRYFSKNGKFSDDLVQDILNRDVSA
eukprot:CAMPEP_0196572562 /NCGR_PEP_ID=MMETSP1081-20130531/2593_1 /TAXON_ID=36882 /ORGANISM="Pyramimonas amylifera, Strain CCMP720" /LENGTH=631 /DNA_ID=CAMNT_0041889921 /DNA_START=521 /DNA_END=2416 /DNA_ORIENTATION=-